MKSTVETKIIELVKLGHELAKELHCAESAALVSDLASQLEVQLVRSNALAAENAGLTNINAWCHTEAFGNMYREFKTAETLGCSSVDCMHDAMLAALMHAPETPATEAFLAEVRAQGADECVRQLVISDTADDFCDAPNICAMVAHQLRKGVQP